MRKHARPGVEIELEGRAKRVGRSSRAYDTSSRPRTGRRHGCEETDGPGRYAFRAGGSDSRHNLDVEVTRRGIEITERARAEQPCTNQPVAKRVA